MSKSKPGATPCLNQTLEHPHESQYYALGASDNLLSRNSLDIAFEPSHYAAPSSQNDFAHFSMRELISIATRDSLKQAFNFESNDISKAELEAMEGFYKEISDARLRLAEITAENLHITNSKSLTYRQSHEMTQTWTTIFQYDSRYHKYLTHFQEQLENQKFPPQTLNLGSCLRLLDEPVQERDDTIILGNVECKSKYEHSMGVYRNKDNANRDEEIKRVDEITALAAKKCLLSDNHEEAIKYALTFNILRGYNVRNLIGACWAQEVSFKALLSSKGLDQVKKAPDIYLDIEACCRSEEELFNKVNQQVSEYTKAVTAENHFAGEFFETKNPATPENFAAYLEVTRQPEKEGRSRVDNTRHASNSSSR